MTTVACVLRSGGLYTPQWVWALKRGLARYAGSHEFRVLSDLGCFGRWGVPLEHGWPKWWGKLELFRPGALEGPIVYLDLDTLPVGRLDAILGYDGPFAMISDFYRPTHAQSGVMAFTQGDQTTEIWRAFSRDPAGAMRKHRGDGEFIRAHSEHVRLQALFPGQIVSLKVDARQRCPEGARLVCGHGVPRFSMPQAGWAHRRWLDA